MELGVNLHERGSQCWFNTSTHGSAIATMLATINDMNLRYTLKNIYHLLKLLVHTAAQNAFKFKQPVLLRALLRAFLGIFTAY